MAEIPKTIAHCSYPADLGDLLQVYEQYELGPFQGVPKNDTVLRYAPPQSIPYDRHQSPEDQPAVRLAAEGHPLRLALPEKAQQQFDQEIWWVIQIDGSDGTLNGAFSGRRFWAYLRERRIRNRTDWQRAALILSGAYQSFCEEEEVRPPPPPPRPPKPVVPSPPGSIPGPLQLFFNEYTDATFAGIATEGKLLALSALLIGVGVVALYWLRPFRLIATKPEGVLRIGQLARQEVREWVVATRALEIGPVRVTRKRVTLEWGHHRPLQRHLWRELDRAVFEGRLDRVSRLQRQIHSLDEAYGVKYARLAEDQEAGWVFDLGRQLQRGPRRLLGETIVRTSLTSPRSPILARPADVDLPVLSVIIRRRLRLGEAQIAAHRRIYDPTRRREFAFIPSSRRLTLFCRGTVWEVTNRDEALQAIARLRQLAQEMADAYTSTNLDAVEIHRALLTLTRRYGNPARVFDLPILNGAWKTTLEQGALFNDLLGSYSVPHKLDPRELKESIHELWQCYLEGHRKLPDPKRALEVLVDWVVQLPLPLV